MKFSKTPVLVAITCLLSLSILSCKSISLKSEQKGFEREKELYSYMLNVNKIDLQKEGDIYLFLLQAATCGACTDANLSFILNHFRNSAKLFVLEEGGESKILAEQLEKYPNATVIKDQNFSLDSYGLNFHEDLIFDLKDGAISHWKFINDRNLKGLRRKYPIE